MKKVVTLALYAAIVQLGGCYQEEGQRCESQDDCDQYLFCIFPPTPSVQTGGICRSMASTFDANFGDFATADGGTADATP